MMFRRLDRIVTREEIKNRVRQLLGDQEFRSRGLNLKEKAMDSVKEGGPSYNNFQKIVEWLKAYKDNICFVLFSNLYHSSLFFNSLSLSFL